MKQLGWSARELSERAWGKRDAKASNTIATLREGGEPSATTLSELAVTLQVSEDWLLRGIGSAPTSLRTVDRTIADAPSPSAHDEHIERDDLPPGCLAQGKNYAARKATAMRLAGDVPEPWVWDDLDTTDTLFLGTREPSPQVLADLARLIQKHGRPR
jgi:transcriptional regulator with XRE-family HTH domain